MGCSKAIDNLIGTRVVLLNTRTGVKSVNPSLPEMAFLFGASRRTVFTRINLLAALPEVLAGIGMGLIFAVKGITIDGVRFCLYRDRGRGVCGAPRRISTPARASGKLKGE